MTREDQAALLALAQKATMPVQSGEEWSEHLDRVRIGRHHLSLAGARVIALAEHAERLEAMLREARESILAWSSYVGPHFHEKHGLAHELARIDALLGGKVPA